jgi:hypothetical protein
LINGVPQMSIAIEDADDLAELVNHLQIQQAKATLPIDPIKKSPARSRPGGV